MIVLSTFLNCLWVPLRDTEEFWRYRYQYALFWRDRMILDKTLSVYFGTSKVLGFLKAQAKNSKCLTGMLHAIRGRLSFAVALEFSLRLSPFLIISSEATRMFSISISLVERAIFANQCVESSMSALQICLLIQGRLFIRRPATCYDLVVCIWKPTIVRYFVFKGSCSVERLL